MALIGQIRKNSWLLIVMIGIGLGGFILMDFITAKQRGGGGGSQFDLGKVEGQKIDRQNFERAYSLLYSNSNGDVNGRRNYLWNYFVEEVLVKQEAENLGLGVSKAEMNDLEFGTNPSRIIVSRFSNPNAPGQVDRQQLNNIKQIIEEDRVQDAIAQGQLSQQFIPYWKHQRDEITKDRLQTKLNSLVQKAMYAPGWMTQMGYGDQSQLVDFSFVKVPYDEIDPTEVSLSNADYEAFLNENAERYKEDEESRVLSFVTINVEPTEADKEGCKNRLAEIIEGFKAADTSAKDSAYVQRYGGIIDAAYFKDTELSANLKDTLFDIPVGEVYGPYEDNGVYTIVKVRDRKVIPDSVRSRHILRPVNTIEQFTAAQNTIDSLKNLIENGTNTFEELAAVFGTDGTSTKGGDLGYAAPGGMVKPFNDLIFFEAEQGQLYTVVTQFGLHLVEVTGKKIINNKQGVKLAFISEDIVPSEDTRNAAYEKATAFIGQNRTLEAMEAAAAQNPDMTVETTAPLKANDYTVGSLGATDDARDIVKWAFTAKKGVVSNVVYTFKDQRFFYDNKYVAVALKAIQKPGIPTVENIKEEIQTLVLDQKRAEMIMAQIQGMDMEAIAAKYSIPVDSVAGVSFKALNVTGLGNEPKVVATAFGLENGGVSAPVQGTTGVFVIKMNNKPALGTPNGLTQIRQTIQREDRGKVAGQLFEAMKRKAKVDDNRSTFY
jgi:peptidyl-prolyl cis-trans isomerase D